MRRTPPDRFGMAVAAAITTWISFQALINMGTVTDTLPITGVPLPFMSYGGTALLTLGLGALAALLRIERRGATGARLASLAACVLGMMLTHYYAIAPAAVIGLYTLIHLRDQPRYASWSCSSSYSSYL